MPFTRTKDGKIYQRDFGVDLWNSAMLVKLFAVTDWTGHFMLHIVFGRAHAKIEFSLFNNLLLLLMEDGE
jgi:succinate dehydrogenase/fumarate reductase flavoprotein subunit